jgi:hypothetical protein
VKERDQAIGQHDALSLLELEAAKVDVDRKGLSVLALDFLPPTHHPT